MNEPSLVELLDQNQKGIYQVASSQPGSLNIYGSENTWYVRIWGPSGSAVTVYDDQKFRRGENFQTIQKTTDDIITVPVREQRLPGEQREGIYQGTETGANYNWVFWKAIKSEWWESKLVLGGIDAAAGVVAAVIAQNPTVGLQVYNVASGITGAIFPGGNTSANNCTDNISSLAFGFPLPAPQ
jgi:hypothetical protein